jgi:hypothetical protein
MLLIGILVVHRACQTRANLEGGTVIPARVGDTVAVKHTKKHSMQRGIAPVKRTGIAPVKRTGIVPVRRTKKHSMLRGIVKGVAKCKRRLMLRLSVEKVDVHMEKRPEQQLM